MRVHEVFHVVIGVFFAPAIFLLLVSSHIIFVLFRYFLLLLIDHLFLLADLVLSLLVPVIVMSLLIVLFDLPVFIGIIASVFVRIVIGFQEIHILLRIDLTVVFLIVRVFL